jgi:hypothetical protein
MALKESYIKNPTGTRENCNKDLTDHGSERARYE